MSFTRISLRRAGFTGFMTVSELQAEHYRSVPKVDVRGLVGGVYIALRIGEEPAIFRRANRRPEWTLAVSDIQRCWVPGSPVVYLGKADATEAGNSLRKRVSRYLRAASGHRGGYRTWQLADWENLVIGGKAIPLDIAPISVESALISEHRRAFGREPFANGSC